MSDLDKERLIRNSAGKFAKFAMGSVNVFNKVEPESLQLFPKAHLGIMTCYIVTCIISIAILAAGGGTKINSGYAFSDYKVGADGVTVEQVIATSGQTTAVAEAVVPVYCIIGALFHGLMWKFHALYEPFIMKYAWNPLHWMRSIIMTPLIMTQVCITSYITDVEKVALIVMLSFALVYVEFALDEHHYMVVMIQEPIVHVVSKFYLVSLYVMSFIPWFTMWIILFTNIAFQSSNNNADRQAFPVFFFVFIASILARVHQALYLAQKWYWRDFRVVEWINILLPLVTVFFLTFVSLPASV